MKGIRKDKYKDEEDWDLKEHAITDFEFISNLNTFYNISSTFNDKIKDNNKYLNSLANTDFTTTFDFKKQLFDTFKKNKDITLLSPLFFQIDENTYWDRFIEPQNLTDSDTSLLWYDVLYPFLELFRNSTKQKAFDKTNIPTSTTPKENKQIKSKNNSSNKYKNHENYIHDEWNTFLEKLVSQQHSSKTYSNHNYYQMITKSLIHNFSNMKNKRESDSSVKLDAYLSKNKQVSKTKFLQYEGERERKNKTNLEKQVFSRIYSTDVIDNLFSNFLYSGFRFMLPYTIQDSVSYKNKNKNKSNLNGDLLYAKNNIKKIKEIDGSNNVDLENPDSKNGVNNEDIIISNNKLLTKMNFYNADAFVMGTNIFFSKDHPDFRSPEGIGLLVHELVHIKQLKDSGFFSNNKSSIKLMLNSNQSLKWEQDAIEKEQKIIDYLYSQYYHNYYIENNYDSLSRFSNLAFFGQMPLLKDVFNSSPVFSKPFGTNYMSLDFNSDNLRHSFRYEGLDTQLPLVNIQSNLENRFIESFNPIQNESFEAFHTIVNPINIGSMLTVGIPNQTNNSQISNRNDKNLSLESSQYDFSPPSPPSPEAYSNIPILFASADRNIHHPVSSANKIMSNGNMVSSDTDTFGNNIYSTNNQQINNFPSMDLDYLANKVYDIIKNKIQIQKMRRGIR